MTTMVLNLTEIETTNHFESMRDDHHVRNDDATWILTSAFIIFTMQSGKICCLYPNVIYGC